MDINTEKRLDEIERKLDDFNFWR